MRDLTYRLQWLALRALLAFAALLPMAGRRRLIGAASEWVVRLSPLRRRARRNIGLIWPEMPEPERRHLERCAARNAGRTLAGIWFNADFAAEVADLQAEGLGLDALRRAKERGHGAIIVSGHFGQWEAIRHVLRREGMETGALYRPNNNPYYEPIFRTGIELGGTPIIPKGLAGMRHLMRHLRAGGFVALLPDQYVGDGAFLDFLGQPAATSLAAAELALRYDVPLVPAFAPWEDGAPRVVIEAPIAPSDPRAMMAEFNDRLGAWVRRHPTQWHWLHRRWKYSRRNTDARKAASQL